MRITRLLATVLLPFTLLLSTAAAPGAPEVRADPAHQVRAAESAFAKAMADRDLEAFRSHVSEEALFFGKQGVLRGRDAVVAGWRPFFEGPRAPFSWAPEQVEVLDSGALALSSGPVRDPEGRRIGTFVSIWRREADGRWRVVIDKGCPPCDSPPGSVDSERRGVFPDAMVEGQQAQRLEGPGEDQGGGQMDGVECPHRFDRE